MALVRWEPVTMNSAVRDEPPLRHSRPAPLRAASRWVPAMDLAETGTTTSCAPTCPACAEEDVTIEVEDRVLTVSGERKAEHEAAGGLPPRRAPFGAFRGRSRCPRASTPSAVPRRSTTACSRSASRSPRSASRARSPSTSAARQPDRGRGLAKADVAAGGRGGCERLQSPACRVRHPPARPGLAGPRRRPAPAHGEVRTPAFVPLATKADRQGPRAARGRRPRLRHGARQHVPPVPRPRATSASPASAGCTGSCAGTARSSPTRAASRSSPWATGRWPTRSRAARRSGADRAGAILAIEEEGVRFRSYLDGSERFMGPETSMEVQAALGSDIALVFDECTPFHANRDYTARSTERTHRWLRPLPGLARRARAGGQLVFGIVQGGVHEDLRRASAQKVARAASVDGIAIGGSLGRGQGADARGRRLGDRRSCRTSRKPRHLLGIGEVDDLMRGVELGIDTFDCAMPTRIGRHGMALVPDPERRWRVDLQGALQGLRRAAHGRLPVPGLRRGLQPRLPALPAQGSRADGDAARHAAQPGVRLPAHDRSAGGDPAGDVERGGRRRADRRGAGAFQKRGVSCESSSSSSRSPSIIDQTSGICSRSATMPKSTGSR